MSEFADWSPIILGDLVDGYRGVSYQPSDLLDENTSDSLVLLRANNIQNGVLNFSDFQIVPKKIVKPVQCLNIGDIAVCMSNGSKRLVGKSGQLTVQNSFNCTIGAFCSVFKPKPGTDKNFIKQLFGSPAYQAHIDISLAGSAINNLKNSDIESIPLLIPSKPKQRKIGIVLKSIDETIEKTEALIDKYQQIKAGLMHDLFTRGITADGKLRPPREQAPELYQETSIGWIPKEWSCLPASDLCHPITKGTTPSSFDNANQKGTIPYLRVEHLSFDGSVKLNERILFVSKQIHNSELLRSKVFPGDILMNIVGPPLGKLSLIPELYPEWNTNQAVAIYRLLNKKNTKYLLFYLLSEFSQRWFFVRSKQTSGQVNLTLEMCANIEIPMPNNEGEIVAITDKLSQIYKKIEIENNFLKKLKVQKKGLMHDLLTGKVPVTTDDGDSND